MKLLRSLAGSLLDKWESWKGFRSFSVVNVHQDPRERYTVKLNIGSHIDIYCREISYCLSYSGWWVPDTYFTMYHVYCVCSTDTPDSLSSRLQEDFTVTQFLHPWSRRASQKKAAIDSYISLVLNRARAA